MVKRKRLAFGSCEHCRKRLRGKSYGGRVTRYCVSCAKAHDLEWYTSYIAATRCEQCQKKKRCTALYREHGTSCCISCAKVHSPEWYSAYLIARHIVVFLVLRHMIQNGTQHTQHTQEGQPCCASSAKRGSGAQLFTVDMDRNAVFGVQRCTTMNGIPNT